jgi:hypothetical protein
MSRTAVSPPPLFSPLIFLFFFQKNVSRYKEEMGVVGISDTLLHATKEQLLMARWREPTLSLHGIEGAFYEPGAKTVIPR